MSGHENQMQLFNSVEHAAVPSGFRPLGTGSNRGDGQEIAAMVENLLLPELHAAEQTAKPYVREGSTPHRSFGKEEIDGFLDLLLNGSPGRGYDRLLNLQAGGVALERICLELLAPVAQRLGPMWLDDEMNFSEISIALVHLQSMVSKLARSSTPMSVPPDPDRHIALARAQGEQHAFGLFMVGELFRRSGWQISGGAELETGPMLNDLLASNWIAVLGLTAGSRRQALGLQTPIEEARRFSANPDLVIMVGGAAFLSEPDLLAEIGGDYFVEDGYAAVMLAEQTIKKAAKTP